MAVDKHPKNSTKYGDDVCSHFCAVAASRTLAKSNSWDSCDLSALYFYRKNTQCLNGICSFITLQFIAARGPIMCTWNAGIQRMIRLLITSWGETSVDFLPAGVFRSSQRSSCPIKIFVVSLKIKHIRLNVWDLVAFRKVDGKSGSWLSINSNVNNFIV